MTEPRRLVPPSSIVPAAAPVLSVQFFLRHGAIVTWPVPTEAPFSFMVLCTNVRANGFFMTEDFYIPQDEIACIGLTGGKARVRPPPGPVPVQPHPTKQ